MLERLLDEQETVLKDPQNTPLTWEHLGEMELLHDCMRETLRMYPPLVGVVLCYSRFARSCGCFDSAGVRVLSCSTVCGVVV